MVGPIAKTPARWSSASNSRPPAAGSVTGIRFYKNPWNTGHACREFVECHRHLAWFCHTSRMKLPLGWQKVILTTPVTLTPGTTYVVSYHLPEGNYSADFNYFATPRTSGPLKAPATGGNSVFAYGTTSVFPSNSGGTDQLLGRCSFCPRRWRR